MEIQVTFQPLRNLYTIRDHSGFRVRYGYQNVGTGADDKFNALYNSSDDPNGTPQNFYMDSGMTIPPTEYFNLQPTLQVNFVYLADEERKFMSAKPLQYITTQIQGFNYQAVNNRTKFDLDAHNMIRRMIWFARRSDAIVYRNDYLNCTNWKYADIRPVRAGVNSVPATITGSSGIITPGTQREILQSARIMCMGNEIFE